MPAPRPPGHPATRPPGHPATRPPGHDGPCRLRRRATPVDRRRARPTAPPTRCAPAGDRATVSSPHRRAGNVHRFGEGPVSAGPPAARPPRWPGCPPAAHPAARPSGDHPGPPTTSTRRGRICGRPARSTGGPSGPLLPHQHPRGTQAPGRRGERRRGHPRAEQAHRHPPLRERDRRHVQGQDVLVLGGAGQQDTAAGHRPQLARAVGPERIRRHLAQQVLDLDPLAGPLPALSHGHEDGTQDLVPGGHRSPLHEQVAEEVQSRRRHPACSRRGPDPRASADAPGTASERPPAPPARRCAAGPGPAPTAAAPPTASPRPPRRAAVRGPTAATSSTGVDSTVAAACAGMAPSATSRCISTSRAQSTSV